jgi:hypothetical protein
MLLSLANDIRQGPKMKRLLSGSLALASLAVSHGALGQTPQKAVNVNTSPPDCTRHVNYDRNADLPGYLVERGGEKVCIPFLATDQLIPADYTGKDFYGEEFTDAKIRDRWAECKKKPECAESVIARAKTYVTYEERETGTVDPVGKIDPHGNVDLAQIRRPAYFGKVPYQEPIAQSEARAYTVEFTVPRDSYEQLHLKLADPIKLRGWYLQGEGIEGPSGRVRALVIMNNGGGREITSIDNPSSQTVVQNPETKKWAAAKFPDAQTEQPAHRHWRSMLRQLNAAGFDVLVTDRRGNGLSGGRSGYNTAEQANDMFRELDQLGSGTGLRVLTPSGETLSGKEAADRLLAGQDVARMPKILGGYSRGSYATAWAMHKNFVEDCNYDLNEPKCQPALNRPNIVGAILYGPNPGALGYRSKGTDVVEAAVRSEFNTTATLDSSVLANIGKWPGVLIARGTWDLVEGLEGSFDAYRRAAGPKELFVFPGPHQFHTQAPENMQLVGERMVAFAKAATLGKKAVDGSRSFGNLHDVVASSPDHWEQTNAPK